MNTYAERLAWAMRCRGLSPSSDQSKLAHMVGKPCQPQNIQHLLDPNKNAKSSKYTPRIAQLLKCDALWLAEGSGTKPVPTENNEADVTDAIETKFKAATNVSIDPLVLTVPSKILKEHIDQFVLDLREVHAAGDLTPHRFVLLRELLNLGSDFKSVGAQLRPATVKQSDLRLKIKRRKEEVSE